MLEMVTFCLFVGLKKMFLTVYEDKDTDVDAKEIPYSIFLPTHTTTQSQPIMCV